MSENPLKMLKNAFVRFACKALLILEMFTFWHFWYFGCAGTRLDKNVKVNFKIYDVTSGIIKIQIDILPDISRSKGNQKMKFGQLVGYNMRNIFLEISCTKHGGETSPYLKKSKLSILLN